jgi:hypothetical protein
LTKILNERRPNLRIAIILLISITDRHPAER